MSNEFKFMTEEQVKEAIFNIHASGFGYYALDKLIKMASTQHTLLANMERNEKATLNAINKIANSSQTPKQKINGIKPLADMRGEEHD